MSLKEHFGMTNRHSHMDMFNNSDGTTLLDPDEIEDLIPTHIVNRHQLNELEQENISQA